MNLKQILCTGVVAAYLALSGCGAATTQTTRLSTATTSTAQPEPSQEECPPRLLYLAVVDRGIAAFYDSDEDGQSDYMELRISAPNGQLAPRPFMYGWDRNGDGRANAQTPGEILYDPAMDGFNGNEMTPEQFQRFQQGQREHPTPPLESRL